MTVFVAVASRPDGAKFNFSVPYSGGVDAGAWEWERGPSVAETRSVARIPRAHRCRPSRGGLVGTIFLGAVAVVC